LIKKDPFIVNFIPVTLLTTTMKFIVVSAFLLITPTAYAFAPLSTRGNPSFTIQVSRAADTDDFASFAASLEEDAAKQKTSVAATGKNRNKAAQKTWQADFERLLDPTTPASQRQILLSDLMNANAEIRASVEMALRDRNVRTVGDAPQQGYDTGLLFCVSITNRFYLSV
jgi:hypothetical protein